MEKKPKYYRNLDQNLDLEQRHLRPKKNLRCPQPLQNHQLHLILEQVSLKLITIEQFSCGTKINHYDFVKDFTCKDEGFFPHPRECKKYFWCLDSGPSNLGIVAHQFTCPSGLVFNKASDSCDYSRNVICKDKKPSETPTTTTTTTTTTHKPIKSGIKTITTTTSTTTTTQTPEVEEDVEEEFEEEEDPKEIKQLITLIKKLGWYLLNKIYGVFNNWHYTYK